MGQHHLSLEHPIDGGLAPVQPSHHHVDAGSVAGLAQGRDRADGHRIVGRPQGVDARALLDELAHRRFRALLAPIQVAYFDQIDGVRPEQLAHDIDGTLETANPVIAGWRVDFPREREDLQRAMLLDPRRFDENRLGDSIAAVLMIGHDAAEPVPIFRARLTVLCPLLAFELVVQQDQRHPGRIGELDELAADTKVVGGDQVIRGRALVEKFSCECDRPVE
jgi:hypothetical protein